MGHMPSENPWLVQISLDLRNCDLRKVLGRVTNLDLRNCDLRKNLDLRNVFGHSHAIGKSMVSKVQIF